MSKHTFFFEIFTVSFGVVLISSFFIQQAAATRAEIMTAESCVTAKWIEFEDRTGEMPDRDIENLWRNECWTKLGATFEVE